VWEERIVRRQRSSSAGEYRRALQTSAQRAAGEYRRALQTSAQRAAGEYRRALQTSAPRAAGECETLCRPARRVRRAARVGRGAASRALTLEVVVVGALLR
jgi:hypothetical protein